MDKAKAEISLSSGNFSEKAEVKTSGHVLVNGQELQSLRCALAERGLNQTAIARILGLTEQELSMLSIHGVDRSE